MFIKDKWKCLECGNYSSGAELLDGDDVPEGCLLVPAGEWDE